MLCVDMCHGLQVLQLAAGDQHSAALTASGFLFTWGCNEQGQLGLPAAAEHTVQVGTISCQVHLCPSPVLAVQYDTVAAFKHLGQIPAGKASPADLKVAFHAGASPAHSQ